MGLSKLLINQFSITQPQASAIANLIRNPPKDRWYAKGEKGGTYRHGYNAIKSYCLSEGLPWKTACAIARFRRDPIVLRIIQAA